MVVYSLLRRLAMKKMFITLALVLFIGFSFTSCDNGTTSGGEIEHDGGFITITDIPSEYNGTVAKFLASNFQHFISGDWTIIKNNKVKIPLFAKGFPYKKSETIITDRGVNILGNSFSTDNKWSFITIGTDINATTGAYKELAIIHFPTITFLDGNATLSCKDGIVYKR